MMLNKLKRRIIMIFLIICIVISGNIYPMDIKASESIAEKSDIYRHDIKTKTNDETDNVANKSENNVIVGVPRPNILYTSGEDEQKYKAIKKVWDFIQLVDPNAFETYDNMYVLSDEQKAELKNVAVNEIKDCTTDYQKAKALYNYVADNIYYDYAYYNDRTQKLYINPYDVYKYKRTVCSGYARLYATLCGLVNIHTMELIGEDHEYNAVYCKEEGRWIFVDSTWGSGNSYDKDEQQNEVWDKYNISYDFFDSSIEFISNLTNHEVLRVSNISYENAVYNFSPGFDDWKNMSDWENMDRWHLEIVKSLNNMQKEIYGIPVTVIGACTDTEIEVLDLSSYTNIEKIGYYSFANLEKLKKIILPKSVTEICEDAFWSCGELESINLQDCSNLKQIKDYAFGGCQKLEKLILPSSITDIGNYSFVNCGKLTKIDLSNTAISSIGEYAFCYDTSVGEIRLPASLKSIGEYAFSELPLLKVLYLPMDSVDIGTGAFDLVSSTSEYKTSVVVTDMTEDKLQGLKCDLRSFVIGKYAYTINYDGNGESSGTMDFDIAAGGVDYSLKECVYQKDNDLFIGWNTKKDGTGQQYDDMANVNSLVGDGESITLYAQWSRSGDLDGDSKVTTKDLMILLYGVSGRNQLTELQQKSADIDRDGKVTVSDLTRLLYYVSGRNSYL